MNREKAERRKSMLLLGAMDMDQTIAAAEAIQREERSADPNDSLIRALSTAVVVCYWRPFAQSKGFSRLGEKDAHDSALHVQMGTWRDEVHAHTDEASGRSAGITQPVTSAGTEGLAYTESWWYTPPSEELPRIIDVAARQREAWRVKAAEISRRLSTSE